MYFPCISLAAWKYSSPSTKLTNPYPLLLVVRLSRTTLAFCTEGNLAKAFSKDSSVTSPARFPTNSRKCEGSHSSKVGSCHFSPPPVRMTVFCLPSAPAATPVSLFVAEVIAELVIGVAVPSFPRVPRGVELANVADPLPSPALKFRPTPYVRLMPFADSSLLAYADCHCAI